MTRPSVHTFICIWDFHTLAIIPLKLPSMKRALYAASHYPSSHSQVGTQVRAVGIHHVGLPILAPKHCHLLTWGDELESGEIFRYEQCLWNTSVM